MSAAMWATLVGVFLAGATVGGLVMGLIAGAGRAQLEAEVMMFRARVYGYMEGDVYLHSLDSNGRPPIAVAIPMEPRPPMGSVYDVELRASRVDAP